MKIKLFLLFFIFLNSPIIAKKISIIIPCAYRHAQHLKELLQAYEQQTLLPDEIVISISNANRVTNYIEIVAKNKWKFPVKILTTNNMLRAGPNRNIACSHATGELFICQDADDIPHPQRNEIIHYVFEKYDFDILHHGYDARASWKIIKNMDEVPVYHVETAIETYKYRYALGIPALSPKLFKQLKWNDEGIGEDRDFMIKAYELTKKTIIVDMPIYQYRENLSATKLELFVPIVINCDF